MDIMYFDHIFPSLLNSSHVSCVYIVKQESMMLRGWSWLEICVYFINFNERMTGSLTRVQIFNWSELNHELTYENRRECFTCTDLNF